MLGFGRAPGTVGGSSSLRDPPCMGAGLQLGQTQHCPAASSLGQRLKVRFGEKNPLCTFWRRLISGLQIEFPSV